MAIYWTRELEIGVAPIDYQHQQLFDRVDALVGACQAGRCRDEVEPLLQFLQEYVLIHFLEEEELMRLSGYPDLTDHARDHAAFGEHLQQLVRNFNAEGVTPTLRDELNATVIDWLYEHIGGRDRALGRWLARQAGQAG